MYGETEPAATERTAFRQAEKKYKLYKPPSTKGRGRKKPIGGGGGGSGDLSEVVDFRVLLADGVELPAGIESCDCAGFDLPVFRFLDRPGFYFIPGALSSEEQCYWIRESLKTFPQPPNRTNLAALYGPIFNLLTAAKDQKILLELHSSEGHERNERNDSGEETHSINFKFVELSEIEKGEHVGQPQQLLLFASSDVAYLSTVSGF